MNKEKPNAAILPSDKMTDEEYAQEDLSVARNIIRSYKYDRSPRKVVRNYKGRIERLVDEIIRDPRNYALVPDFLLTNQAPGATLQEPLEFERVLREKADVFDMRNKVERMMFKPTSQITYAERMAFILFAKVKNIPNLNGYEHIVPQNYFKYEDRVYQGHKRLRDLNEEKKSMGDNISKEYEDKYREKVADIVIHSPQIFWELPPEIKDDLNPNNQFYVHLLEKKDILEQYKEEVEKIRLSGKELTQEDLFKEGLLKPVEEFSEVSELYAEQQLLKLEEHGKKGEEVFLEDEYLMKLTEEDINYFNSIDKTISYDELSDIGESDEYSTASPEDLSRINLDDYIPPENDNIEINEEIYYEMGINNNGVNYNDLSLDIPENFASIIDLESKEPTFFDDFDSSNVLINEIGIDELDEGSLSRNFKDEELFNSIVNDWNDVVSKDALSAEDGLRLADIEKEMGKMVAKDNSLYISVPVEVSDFKSGNNIFFNEIISEISSNKNVKITDHLLKNDIDEYALSRGIKRDGMLEQKNIDDYLGGR